MAVTRPRRVPVQNQPLRLVKTWLPAALVKEMDETIVTSGGAYNGRDDFIREAISDRIAEDRARPEGGPAPVILLRPTVVSKDRKPSATAPSAPSLLTDTTTWVADRVPTLPPHKIGGLLYGLHNRDYPTLWATHSLIAMTANSGAPISWQEFLRVVLKAAWELGTHLSKLDQERSGEELKASIGFPSNAEKRQSSEARFIEHMIGVPDREAGPTGPLFAMQLAGTQQSSNGLIVAPTADGIGLWQRLATIGYAATERPPYSDDAWRVFRDHLKTVLPDDYAAFARVLREISAAPTRDDLVRAFSAAWPGAAAATNIAAYVSRGREWGLVEGKLQHGRYSLTDFGRGEIEETLR